MGISYREALRSRRHKRIRKKVFGTGQRPRLAVHRSHLNLMVQLIDDLKGKTLVACSTRDKELRKGKREGGNVEAAKHLGERIALLAKQAGIAQAVFDRGGHPYHGRVKALAEGVRSGGLEM